MSAKSMATQNNLRRIKLTETGRWTLLSAADRAKPIHLCDYCSIKSICLSPRRLAAIVVDFDLAAVISECAGYRPFVSFRDSKGLDATFNTVRLGKAWHDRVKVGGRVTLWSGRDEAEIGTAEVTGKHVGRYCDLAPEHARFNHSQLGLPDAGAPERLTKVLIGSYGSTFFKPERAVSVIYMRRLDGAEA